MTPRNSAALRWAERTDLLLDRARRDHAVGHHRSLLPDPVRAVDRLGLGGGVPPGVQQEAVVGLCQVQAEAAGLQADADGLRGRLVADVLRSRHV